MPTGAGELRDRVRFDRDGGTTSSSAGTHSRSDTTVCTRPVKLRLIGEADFAALRALYPEATHAAVTRYDSTTTTIAPGQLATWVKGNIEYEVLGTLDPDNRRRWLHVALKQRFLPGSVAT